MSLSNGLDEEIIFIIKKKPSPHKGLNGSSINHYKDTIYLLHLWETWHNKVDTFFFFLTQRAFHSQTIMAFPHRYYNNKVKLKTFSKYNPAQITYVTEPRTFTKLCRVWNIAHPAPEGPIWVPPSAAQQQCHGCSESTETSSLRKRDTKCCSYSGNSLWAGTSSTVAAHTAAACHLWVCCDGWTFQASGSWTWLLQEGFGEYATR